MLVNSDAYESISYSDNTAATLAPAQLPTAGQQPGQSLEQQVVKLQWSNIRTEPNGESRILRSLDIGAVVNVTGVASGRWIEIESTGDNPQRGYMHASTLGPRR